MIMLYLLLLTYNERYVACCMLFVYNHTVCQRIIFFHYSKYLLL